MEFKGVVELQWKGGLEYVENAVEVYRVYKCEKAGVIVGE